MKVNIQAILNDPFVAKLNGVVSRGIKEADINEEGHLIFTLTDDSTVDLGKVVGETGPAGRDGRDGVDGQNGAPGRDGRDGSDGAPGQPGADGHSPVVTAQKSGTTTTIKVDGAAIATISDGAPGQQGTPGTPGTPGANGVSPTVSTSAISGGHRVSITDASGTHTFNVMDGTSGSDGVDGEDGYSPTVSVETIEGGHRVTITDVSGDHAFNVMDGESGASEWSEVANKPFESIGSGLSVSGGVLSATGGGGGVSVHGQLTGRDASDQHPMSAITGLAQALSGKQGIISDLDAIRSGAAAGATALQSVPSTYRTAAAQDVIDATKQDKLTAGENITIEGDVISASGGGSTEISIGQQTPSGEEVLWIDPNSTGEIPVYAPLASVGQIIRVKTVDGSGKPTEWEAVDMPGGGGGGDWRMIRHVTLTEQADRVDINTDEDGNAFSLHHVVLITRTRTYETTSAFFTILVNRAWGGADPYIHSCFKPTVAGTTWLQDEAFECFVAGSCANIFEHWKPYITNDNYGGNRVGTYNPAFDACHEISFIGKFDAGSEFAMLGR